MRARRARRPVAFLAVAEERSFTRAAARLGVSQSALSHTIRGWRRGSGLRLLTRTTRSVAPTEAGERLIETLRPAFDEIDAELAALSELREKPAGTIRITTGEHAAQTILLARAGEAAARLSRHQGGARRSIRPDRHRRRALRRRRASRRAGGQGHDRGAHRAGHAHGGGRRAVLFRRAAAPRTPQDLTGHDCINLRLPTSAGFTPGSSRRAAAS